MPFSVLPFLPPVPFPGQAQLDWGTPEGISFPLHTESCA